MSHSNRIILNSCIGEVISQVEVQFTKDQFYGTLYYLNGSIIASSESSAALSSSSSWFVVPGDHDHRSDSDTLYAVKYRPPRNFYNKE